MALEWCARRGGRSPAEIQRLFMPWRSKAAITLKALRMGLSLSGKPGAPAANQNGVATWFKPGNYPARWRN
jgi:hypothetical protein